MYHQFRFIAAAGIFAAFVFFATAGILHAQVGWGCSTTTITNLTNCDITLTPLSTPAGAFPTTILVPGEVAMVPTGAITSIDWVVGITPYAYTILPPPPIPPPSFSPLPTSSCGGNEWRAECVRLPGASCCCDICFDPGACTITIRTAACPPGCCRP